MSKTGVISIGVKAPIIKKGDDLVKIVFDSVIETLNENSMTIQDGDVIGITESIVARADGNYVTIDDIVQFLTENNWSKKLLLFSPIMSRNRFSMILKAFARFATDIIIQVDGPTDEVGNPTDKINPFTGVDIINYYKELCLSENCTFEVCCYGDINYTHYNSKEYDIVDCRCHTKVSGNRYDRGLANIMTYSVQRADGTLSGHNPEWGLLGSNKANEETLKLFPVKHKAELLVNLIQHLFKQNTGKNVEVLVYGDGCFKSPEYDKISIWEFADPITCPAYTSGLEGTPNEIKIKAFADDQFKNLEGDELIEAVKDQIRNKEKDLVGNMASQGTTPRRYTDLLASLMDLTSGSGDKGTPIILVKNYFKKYSD